MNVATIDIKKIKPLSNPLGLPDLPPPQRSSRDAVAYDLQAALWEHGKISLAPGDRVLIATGYAYAIPAHVAGLICPRSGLAVKNGVTVTNGPGVADPDYRGELAVTLINLGGDAFVIEHGMRIAQILFVPAFLPDLNVVDALKETERGENGFGSTGL